MPIIPGMFPALKSLVINSAFCCRPSDKQPPRDWDPLVKQTYSVWVETDKGRRKWHLSKIMLHPDFSASPTFCSRLLYAGHS
jgi:hypothetical protein